MTDVNTSPLPRTEWYFSRGDAELYDRCPRARFNRTLLDGRGVIKQGSTFELSLGRIIHQSIEDILLNRAGKSWLTGDRLREQHDALYLTLAASNAGDRIEQVVLNGEVPRKISEESHEQFRQEARCLAEGLIWAWGLHIYPLLQANYNIIGIERRAAYSRSVRLPLSSRAEDTTMVLPTVADVVLQSKDDGSYVYPDWKTAAWVNGAWMDSWNRAAQIHTTALAVEQALGEEVEYCYIQALVKGRWQNGYQQSPLCWAYQHVNGELRYKYTAGAKWKRVPQWESGLNMEEWTRQMPQEIAMNLVPRTPPIIIDRDLAETWWQQRVIKETAIMTAKQELADLGIRPSMATRTTREGPSEPGTTTAQYIMDSVFPQHFDQCSPVIGFRCDYYDICHTPTTGQDPIGSGIYRRRPTYEERCQEEGTKP